MSEVKPIFKDPELQAQFDKNGYVKIKFLDAQKTSELYSNYIHHKDAHETIESRYLSTTHTNNPDLILRIDNELKSILVAELVKVFCNIDPMMCTYITKQPGEGSETRLHQDPTFVDEQKYVSANIWVALHDINHQNGNLFFINGTHRFIQSLRVTPNCPTAYDQVENLLMDYLTEVPVNAGEAIIINHAVMHGATPNLSDGLRIAAVMAIRSKGSEWIYHYLEPGAPQDKIEKYNVSLETFVNLQKDGRPDYASFEGYIQWNFPQMEREDFIRKMENLNNDSFKLKLKNHLHAIAGKLFSHKT